MFSFYRNPYFFIFRYNVAGLTFNSSAAFFRCPPHFFKASIMDCLSTSSLFLSDRMTKGTAGVPDCISIFRSLMSINGCSASSTARRILFCNSRTLPGHEYVSSSLRASGVKPVVACLSSPEYFSRKNPARRMMSYGTSDSNGCRISNPARRWNRSSRKVPLRTARFISSLVAATILTSACSSLLLPTGT